MGTPDMTDATNLDEPVRIAPLGGGEYRLTAKLWLARPRNEVFAFFGAAENLQRITPPMLGFEIRTALPIEMGVGTLIDYRIKLNGLPMRWRTEITRWEPDDAFEDTQLRGPYRKWVHTHEFADMDGGTLCTDQVDYAPPLRPIAGLINKIAVQGKVQQIFEFRQRKMRELFS